MRMRWWRFQHRQRIRFYRLRARWWKFQFRTAQKWLNRIDDRRERRGKLLGGQWIRHRLVQWKWKNRIKWRTDQDLRQPIRTGEG